MYVCKEERAQVLVELPLRCVLDSTSPHSTPELTPIDHSLSVQISWEYFAFSYQSYSRPVFRSALLYSN